MGPKIFELEDLKGKNIVDARVRLNMPPEEMGQLELELNDGRILSFNNEIEYINGNPVYCAVARIDHEEVYRAEYRPA